MARQFSDDERERMARGGQWLRQERKRRGFDHGTDFADALGIKQVRLSAYERGLYPVPETVAREIARVLDLSEVDTWRGLELPLPAEVRTDEATVKWARARLPELMDELPDAVERITGGKPPESRREEARKPPRVTRKSDKPPLSSQGRESAV